MASGQSFLELLEWHPRDVDTLIQLYRDADPATQEREREEELRRQWQSQSPS